ncbi:MAG: uroporphyrinogen-III decarboxylase-like protein [Armatimonadetes bacterium]|nr:uroporphyrinogen-III decarboxylase-like protein [Armatimonadota bacterium]
MEDSLLIPGLEHKKANPDFSRLRDAMLRGNRSDRLPFLELFADVEVMAAILGRPIETVADRVEFWYRLGYDSVQVGGGLYFHAPRKSTPNTAELAQGDRWWVCDDVCPIQTREDFEKYDWPVPEKVSTQEIEETVKYLPEGMGIRLQSGGILENVMWLMGYTGLATALYEDPQLVQDVFDEVGNRKYRAIERVIDCPEIGCVFFGEDMGFKTSTMISPEHLRRYHFPHLKRIVDLVHRHQKFFILHSCGNLTEIMDDLIDYVGIDAKHSFEDAIMPVTEFKKIYGHRVAVVGGVDVDALARMQTSDFRKYVRRIIEECAPSGGYALGSGNSVTNYVKIENYLAMLEEGWHYREAIG